MGCEFGKCAMGVCVHLLEKLLMQASILLQRFFHGEDFPVIRSADRTLFFILAQAALMKGVHAQKVYSG